MEKLASKIDKPEKASLVDLFIAKLAARRLRNIVKGAEIARQVDLDFCIRPSREIADMEREYYIEHGYGARLNPEDMPRSKIMLAQSVNETGLFYTSSHRLERRSHRFRLREEGSVQYHREAFDVDPQTLGSSPVNLESLKEIAGDPQAKTELRWLSANLRGVSSDTWRESGSTPTVRC